MKKDKLEVIARDYLDIPTLRTRNSDHLDFYEVAVWGVKATLEKAYEEGKKAERQNQKKDG